MKINFKSGGSAVLDRIIKAYGFRTKSELANHLNITLPCIVLRYKRDNFPSDIVVRCMSETGFSLEWLATGEGRFYKKKQNEEILSEEILEKLERLLKLKEKGILTDEELNELKARLI